MPRKSDIFGNAPGRKVRRTESANCDRTHGRQLQNVDHGLLGERPIQRNENPVRYTTCKQERRKKKPPVSVKPSRRFRYATRCLEFRSYSTGCHAEVLLPGFCLGDTAVP